jgi:hypothetical protein
MVYPCDFLALHLEITGTSASGFKMLVVDQQVDLSGILCVCVCVCVCYLFILWCNSPQWARATSVSRLHDNTQTHHT